MYIHVHVYCWHDAPNIIGGVNTYMHIHIHVHVPVHVCTCIVVSYMSTCSFTEYMWTVVSSDTVANTLQLQRTKRIHATQEVRPRTMHIGCKKGLSHSISSYLYTCMYCTCILAGGAYFQGANARWVTSLECGWYLNNTGFVPLQSMTITLPISPPTGTCTCTLTWNDSV